MANTILSAEATEKSTFVITAEFYDEDGVSVSPNALTWTLTDINGNVINEREDVVITPASSVTIVLIGDDLAVTDTTRTVHKRYLTIEGTYDSTYGSDLDLKASVEFEVKDLIAVS